jgi:hypothetical protein
MRRNKKNYHSINLVGTRKQRPRDGQRARIGTTGSQDWDKDRWRQRGWDQNHASPRASAAMMAFEGTSSLAAIQSAIRATHSSSV